LIFGERHPKYDATWHNELWSWRETGRLSQLDLAFSRVQAADMPQVGLARWHPGYVQQVLHKHSLELKSWLNQGAVMYLCGSRMGMAKDVELRLHALLGEDGFKRLLEQERLKCDLY
jgi:sulfite reductase (NADPH) flavoprotein alpha-component